MLWKIQISEATKRCTTCGTRLVLHKNWLPCRKKTAKYICTPCNTASARACNNQAVAASARLGLGHIGPGGGWRALPPSRRKYELAHQRGLETPVPQAANVNPPAVPRPPATITDYIESDTMAALKAENARRVTVQEEKEGIFKRKDGSVYVMINEVFRRPVFKIGGAFDLRERLATFQTGDPDRRYKMPFSRHFPNQNRAEAAVHRALADLRVPGSREWYNGSYQDGIAMIREFAQRH